MDVISIVPFEKISVYTPGLARVTIFKFKKIMLISTPLQAPVQRTRESVLGGH